MSNKKSRRNFYQTATTTKGMTGKKITSQKYTKKVGQLYAGTAKVLVFTSTTDQGLRYEVTLFGKHGR